MEPSVYEIYGRVGLDPERRTCNDEAVAIQVVLSICL